MNLQLLNSAEDVRWMRDKLASLDPPEFGSCVLHGNEDAPERVELYLHEMPDVTDEPIAVYVQDPESGDLKRMRTIYAVGCESTSSGGVDWYSSREAADLGFDEAVRQLNDWEINLFSFEVEDGMSDDDVTSEADALLWDREYEPLRSHNRGASISKS